MLERILVPLDGSETAESILPQLRRLFHAGEAEVLFLRSVSLLASGVGLHPISGLDGSFVLRALEAEAARYLDELAGDWRARGIQVRWAVKVGEPAQTILEFARSEKATLIALSTHGRSGLSRWLLGSVAEKVLRASSVPVLLVRSFRPAAGGEIARSPREELTLRRILVPTDLSRTSLAIAPEAGELARRSGARIEVLHVAPPPRAPAGEETPDEARHALAEAIRAFEATGESAVPILRHGDPATAILDACAERSIDLIAMTTHGESGLARWTLGSVAEKVLRGATIPMLVVRQPRRGPAERGPTIKVSGSRRA